MKPFVSFVSRAAVVAMLLATSTSCDLLNQQSPQDFTPEDVFSSPSRIDKAVVGMYDAMQDGAFLGSFALIYSDVRSDDVDLPAGFQNLATSTMLSSDGNALGAWSGGYRSMYTANYIIRELTKRDGAGLSPQKYKQYLAEAKFLRALCHFTLVNLFAHPYNYTADASHLGVPIQLEAPDGIEAYLPAQQKPRATVKQVYDQIIEDLTEAATNLPETQGTGTYSVARATKDAALGLLSRVYLYKRDYAKAAQYAGEVISSGRHQLNPTAYQAFKVRAGQERNFDLDRESIFFIAQGLAGNDNPNTNAAIGQFYAPKTSITITPYRNALPSTDRRRVDLVITNQSKYYTRKYTGELETGAPGGSNLGAWIPMVRYPEVLLNRAEALAHTPGGAADAVTLLNQVRDRSKPTTSPSYTVGNFTNTQALVNAILLERRFELAFEGHRLYDLFRNEMPVPAHGSGATQVAELGWREDRSIMPIPANEIQRNPALVQNDGY